MAEHTFRWPKGPQEVIITGDFDKWSGSLPLVKNPQGDFAITMPIAQTSNDRFAFKFIVDGEWRTSSEYQTTVQPDGIVNNFVVISSLGSAREATSKSSSAGGRIPEIGLNLVAPEVAAPVLGTQAPQKAQPAPRSNKKNKKKKIQIKRRIRRNKKTGERTILSEERSELKSGSEDETYETEETATATGTSREETPLSVDLGSTDAQQQHQPSTDFSSTVMPSSENKQTTLGEPGIAIVPNAANIKEFSEIRDVDADELNERLNRELAEKQKAETPIEKQNEKSAPVLATSETEKPVSEKPVSEKPVSEKDVSAPEFPVVAKNISPPEFPVTEKATLPTKNTVEEKDAASTKVLVEGEQVSAPETPVLQKKATEPESSIPEKKIAPAVLPTSEKNLAGDETAISAPESSSAAKESGSATLATSGIALASAGVPIEKSIKSSGLIEEDVPSPRLSAESDVGAATENLSISTPLKKNVDTESAPEVLPVPQTFDQGILDPARSQPVAKDSSVFASASAADAAATAAASKAVADAATEDTIASPKVDLSSEAKSDVPATGTKVVSEDIPLTEPVHTPEASAPVIDTVESPKDKNLAPVPLFEDPSVAQAGATDPAATTKSSATEEHVSKPLVTKEVSETAVIPPAELSSEQRSVGSRPDDVDIVIVEGELNELPPQFSPTTATSKSVPEASQDEPADVIRGVPDSTDLVPKESGDAFEESAVSQKSGPIVTEEIGVITSPEQEAELIRKTLDPKASSPGEIEELLIVEGNIPPSQVAEYQAASEAAAAKVIASQKPEEVVVQQDANPKESSKPAPAKNSTTKQKPASPPATKSTEKDKKKKKGLFSKIKKIFH